MVSSYERGSTWKSQVTYTSGSSYIDCSSNVTNLTVYRSDGTVLLGPVSGVHASTGIYHYYVSTQSTDSLGLYVCEWKTYFNYGNPWVWLPKLDREVVHIKYVE